MWPNHHNHLTNLTDFTNLTTLTTLTNLTTMTMLTDEKTERILISHSPLCFSLTPLCHWHSHIVHKDIEHNFFYETHIKEVLL